MNKLTSVSFMPLEIQITEDGKIRLTQMQFNEFERPDQIELTTAQIPLVMQWLKKLCDAAESSEIKIGEQITIPGTE